MSDSGGDSKDIWNDNYAPNAFQPHNINNISYPNQEQFMTQNGNQQGAPSPTGNFSMLPVGHGNFLKVYHNNDDNLKYNNYELFASNSFAPHQMIKTQQQNQENFMFNSSASTSQIHDNNVPQHTAPPTQQHLRNDNSATSVFLNQLVGNWVPNISGTYSPFGETSSVENMNKFPVIVNENHDVNHPIEVIKPVEKPKEIIRPPSFISRKSQSEGQNKSEVKKPRIVAEVKPMRMSYSDVVSKQVPINSKTNISENSGVNNSVSDKPVKILSDKNKGNMSFDKKSDEKEINKPKKNFGKNDNSNNVSYFPERKTNLVDEESKENSGQENEVNKSMNKKKTTKPKGKNKSDNSHSDKKRRSNNTSQPEFEEDYDDDDEDLDDDIEEAPSFFYNVAKTVISDNNSEKLSKPSQHNKRSKGPTVTNRSTTKHEKNTYKRNQKCRRNRNYAFVVKMLEKWLEYSMKILSWFLSLVSDVVFLSFGIVWERVKIGYQYCCQGCSSIKSELKNNSGLPTAWIKNLYKKFDSKFGKDSKWAFWRNLFAKKKIVEPVTDFYKNGRLPQTGDEAMYSLLNCKGKDAYSILGVTTECAQEQIRKHYKKIAVLVHPDKNKQPGAEEAFKILQRAFELIGEPENRKAYDQSLAEALNAEKAWSELNDLLAQLHTKITEAANTIRCSSCGLRHPRKPTGRPHYAARECNSCKIRHSAREGDIWAETTVFGFRWKYLALMEGNVYDITEWANCQKGALSHLQPNSHIVQYRIVLGGQQQQNEKEKVKKEVPVSSEPNLDDFLNNLYGGPNQQPQNASRRRSKKN